jgi:molybdopterin-guanine dinucleotide biosynthesis protein A
MPELAAAITAGGRVDGPFAARIGTDVKALAPWRGRTLIDAALDAARAVGAKRVAVVGGAAVLAHCGASIDEGIAEAPTGEANLRNALATARGDALVFLTSDLPFVDGSSLEDFVARARAADVATAMAVAEVDDYARAFPGASEHTTAIGRERISGGSVFFFAAGAAPRVADVATRVFTARKSVWAMARLLGPALLARFALRRLTIADIEQRADRVLGLRARAIRNAAPALAYDVDNLTDYEYALEHDQR